MFPTNFAIIKTILTMFTTFGTFDYLTSHQYLPKVLPLLALLQNAMGIITDHRQCCTNTPRNPERPKAPKPGAHQKRFHFFLSFVFSFFLHIQYSELLIFASTLLSTHSKE